MLGSVRVAVLLAFLAAGPIASAGPQASEDEAKIERYIDRAREGSPVVRPQAAKRLVAFGAPAVRRLRELAGDTTADLAALGPDLVEVFGQFDAPDFRQRLWSAVGDREFPWRPAAARGWLHAVRSEEAHLVLPLLEDPLSAVQLAAIRAVGTIPPSEVDAFRPVLQRLLGSPVGAVRRAAAVEMDRLGNPWALAYLIEELNREDEFFGVPTGRQARSDALRSLAARLGGRQGYDVSLPPEDPVNTKAVEVFRARVKELLGGRELPELPAVARASKPTVGDLIGLEIRSCRLGEFRLRWNANDVLYVGAGSAAELALEPGAVAKLVEDLSKSLAELGDRHSWGQLGCDHEQLLWRRDAGDRATPYQVTKGPEIDLELRPEALRAALRRALDSIPNDVEPDPRTSYLRHRVCAALAAVGGPVAACAAKIPLEQRPASDVPQRSRGAWLQVPGGKFSSTAIESTTAWTRPGTVAVEVSSLDGARGTSYLPAFRLRKVGDAWRVDIACRWTDPDGNSGVLEPLGGQVTLFIDELAPAQRGVLAFEFDVLRDGRVEHVRGALPASL